MHITRFYREVLAIVCFTWCVLFLNAQEGKLSGVVRNDIEVLPAATVTIGNKTILTNHEGSFFFTLAPGVYTINITHTGYRRIERSVKVNAGSNEHLDFSMVAIDYLDEVATIGSRSFIKRDVMRRPVPIDVIPGKLLQQTGQISLTQMLSFVAPSFNASREVLHEPATLRGLDPQHVLILLNGVRYHNMAWYFAGLLKGQLGRGSVGNDLNSIPFSAIDDIEILRDGAAAQQGSDAIAGVINIRLKKQTGKTAIQLNAGQFNDSHGEKFSFGLYHGISLGNKRRPEGQRGFLALATSYRYQAPTFHGGAFDGTVYYDTARKSSRVKDSLLLLDNKKVADRKFDRRAVADNIGNSKIVSYGLSLNGGYDVSEKMQLFWTATINERKTNRIAAYRFPKFSSQVNHYIYPDGFQPITKTSAVDGTLITGIKGKNYKRWNWNVHSSYGRNAVKTYTTNSNNPTQTFLLKEKAPTSFYTGNDIYTLTTVGTDFSKQFNADGAMLNTANVAWGTEGRLEHYASNTGEEASWKNYDPANYPQFGEGIVENAISRTRKVLGAYVEMENEHSKRLLTNVAARYEYYSDFGSNIGAKFAVIYHLSDGVALRGSVSNGFRAPSLQQRYVNAIQLNISNSGGTLSAAYRGIFSNDHAVAKSFGIPYLKSEKTINVSGGITATLFKQIRVMVDAYWIQIKDRIILSGILSADNPDVKKILDSMPGIRISQVQFFTNAINTQTEGIDITFNANWNIHKTNVGFLLAANVTKTRLYGDIKATDKLPVSTINSNSLFNREEQTKMEHGQPAAKIILTLSAKRGKTTVRCSNTWFGSTKTANMVNATNYVFLSEYFSPKVITDVSVHYDLKKWVTITLGSNNLFDVYPDRIKNYENTLQGIWVYSPDASPFAFNGRYYYLGASFNF